MNIVMIGAGNLASSLAIELVKHKHNIVQVYSRTEEAAVALAQKIGTAYTNTIEELRNDAELYIFSVKDDILAQVSAQLIPNQGFWVHTAGSLPLSILPNSRAGVFYPLQSFTKGRTSDWANIPIFIEAKQASDLEILTKLAKSISTQVYELDSDKRKYVHLTGIFANNFTNHMYKIAQDLLHKANLPLTIAFPIIEETCNKIKDMNPQQAQTGPAVRYDKAVMDSHLKLLESETVKEIYKQISENIYKTKLENE